MKLITLENLKNFWKDVKSYVDNGLSKKADSSHGTHVSYGTINGKAPGTPSAGTSSKVAREDHVHPVQTTVSGNAGTATKLATSRTINGTSFDGSGNITTANWGTARNIQIGNTSKSVNGSANVSWSLSEIGAAPAGYGLGTTCQDKSNQDCNNILVTGFYMGSNMTNKPSGCTQGWIYLLVMRHNDSWVRQVAYDFGTASQVYTRVKQNGSWTAWVATDTNTWRGVQDNLTSTAKDQSLSANQGKVLKGLIDGKAASNHTHSYLPLSGGTLTGETVFNNYLSLNAWPGYGTGKAQIWYNGNNKQLVVQPNAVTDIIVNNNKVYHAGNKPTASEIGAAAASHTHNYAGSSSAGGAANSATKLATARTINGTSFDGSANITTSKWGTARTLTLTGGATGSVSIDGSANVSLATTVNWSNISGKPTSLPANGGNADTVDNLHATAFARAHSSGHSFGGNQNAITTAQFISLLSAQGAFSQPVWISRGSWSYASNQYINDTGCGNIHLAGCTIEVIGNSTNYTIRIHTPTTSSSGVTNGDFIYVNNGTDYSPGWRRIYNNKYKPTAADVGALTQSTADGRYMRQANANGYYGMTANGDTSNWVRTTNSGIIPYQSGGASSLGTSSWPFNNIYANNIYDNGTLLEDKFLGKTATAAAATKLATARTINGTSFDGTANITTANWGTARTITIGSTGKSINGSGNVSWSLSEIGAASTATATTTTNGLMSKTDKSNLNEWETFKNNGGTINGAINVNDANLKGSLNFSGIINNTDLKTENKKIFDVKRDTGDQIYFGNGSLKMVLDAKEFNAYGAFNCHSGINIPNKSISPIGYTKLPNGLIMQWGEYYEGNLNFSTFFFPISFPNKCISIQLTTVSTNKNYPAVKVAEYTNSQVTINNNICPVKYTWIAIGY